MKPSPPNGVGPVMATKRVRGDDHEPGRDTPATGRTDDPELNALRRQLYPDGKMNRTKAELVVELHKRVQHPTPAVERLFYQTIKEHLLTDGWIDAADVAWLRRMLFADATVDDAKRRFLQELKDEAKKVSREFERLFAESMNGRAT